MAIVVKDLISSKYAEATSTTQYTASGVTAIIDKFTAVNRSASDATISVYLVPSGGTAGDSNIVLKNKSINPGDTYSITEAMGHVLEAQDSIVTIASVASAISLKASGREIT